MMERDNNKRSKHLLEMHTANAVANVLWKKKSTQHDTKHPDTDVFLKKQSCTYLVNILTLAPTAEFCASTMYAALFLVSLSLGLFCTINKFFCVFATSQEYYSIFCSCF